MKRKNIFIFFCTDKFVNHQHRAASPGEDDAYQNFFHEVGSNFFYMFYAGTNQ